MSNKENELVLVFKTELLKQLGDFQGVNPDYKKYIDKMNINVLNMDRYFIHVRKSDL